MTDTDTTGLVGVCYREGAPTAADYYEAIADLQRAKRQPECMHICCSICEDTGHTAETCRHNPLLLARRWTAATKVWACYHCGFVATNDQEAREHFGPNDQETARCLTAQSARIAALEADIRRKDEALRACLSYEEAKAHLIGLSDCTCVFHSREADREYEAGRCPHQLARAALNAQQGSGSDG